MRQRTVCLSFVSIVAATLAACGGGGGGDGGGGAGNPAPPPPPPPAQTYSIGGAATGLSGSGLILRNNGGDDLPIAADGTFTFGNELAAGGAYAITIAAQPGAPNQICTLANASGSIVAADVGDIAVNCVTLFGVGGTVTGLQGAGLTLHNNGGDALAIAGDGLFTFPGELLDGSPYAVTIGTQPSTASQLCSVSDGHGALAGAPVTQVLVTCATSYTIGGTVTGLSDTGLVLQLNGGTELAVAGNSFQFATPVADGTAYIVSVLNEPDTRNCALANGSGTVAGANVVNLSVTCKGWGTARLLETSAQPAENPQIALDGNGDGIAIWSQWDGVRLETWAARFTASDGWQTPENIDGPRDPVGVATQDTVFGFPRVSANAAGQVEATWLQWLRDPFLSDPIYRAGVWRNRYEPGTGWLGPQALVEGDVGPVANASSASAALAGNGVAATVWQQRANFTGERAWAQIQGVSSGEIIADAPQDELSESPRIAVDAAGNYLVVWRQPASDGAPFRSRRSNVAIQQWNATSQSFGGIHGSQTANLQLAMNSSGQAFAAWQTITSDGTHNDYDIVAARYLPGGGWWDEQRLSTNEPFRIDHAISPQVAIDAAGNALVVWKERAGELESVRYSRFTAGGGWDAAPGGLAESHDDRDLFGDISDPHLAMNADGTAMAVWWAWDAANSNTMSIWANRYTPESGWGNPLRVESDDATHSTAPHTAPRVVIDGAGNAVVIWAQLNGGVYSIWANRFE